MPDSSSTILLVDDEDSIQKLLAYPLQREGFRVLQARDGEDALRLFNSEHVDLVVLDLMLPKLDGLEVCKRLRADSEVPIIMLTARDDELDKVLGLELGADDRRPRTSPAREAGAGSRRARVHSHRAGCRLPLPGPVNPFRSVGARLGLGLAVVVAAALVLVDLIVVPSLERKLTHAKLAQLREAAPSVGVGLANSPSYALDGPIQAADAGPHARRGYLPRLG